MLHRDAALRNVLLKEDFTVKIADFGLSRRTGDDGTYEIKRVKLALPVRYIAPETLKSGRFNVQSELWAFGVVLWELFTFAKRKPYESECEEAEDLMEKILALIEGGHRLSIPKPAPKPV